MARGLEFKHALLPLLLRYLVHRPGVPVDDPYPLILLQCLPWAPLPLRLFQSRTINGVFAKQGISHYVQPRGVDLRKRSIETTLQWIKSTFRHHQVPCVAIRSEPFFFLSTGVILSPCPSVQIRGYGIGRTSPHPRARKDQWRRGAHATHEVLPFRTSRRHGPDGLEEATRLAGYLRRQASHRPRSGLPAFRPALGWSRSPQSTQCTYPADPGATFAALENLGTSQKCSGGVFCAMQTVYDQLAMNADVPA